MAPLEATPTGDAAAEAKSPDAQPTEAGPGPESFFQEQSKAGPAAGGDPFSAMDQAKAKEDFDNAFASFKAFSGSKGSSGAAEAAAADPAKGFSAFNAEFPPITELEHDDESDSEDGEGGFDDDFAPASPNEKGLDKPGSPSLNKVVASDAPPSGAEDEAEKSKQADDIFGSAPPPGSFPEAEAPLASATPAATQPATVSKESSAFDDLDDDFADLEDAKEGSQDDDFQTISRSGLDDFNPTFDSPPPAGKSESTGAPPGSSSGNAPAFGTESTFDFASIDNTASQASGALVEGAGEKQADNHDWDAIFASLDDAPPAQSSASPPPPGSSGSVAPAPAPAPAGAAETSSKENLRPEAPGRALTEDGVHDDPILKNLTSMGYSRADSLNALEKYDYNLERVS